NRNVGLQGFPGRVDVAGPEEGSVTLHSGTTVAMQRVGTFVGAVELGPFPVHAVASETRFAVQRIALVGPPAIHTKRESFAVGVPGAARLLFIEAGDVAGIADRAAQVVLENYGVQDNVEMFPMEFFDGLLGVGKDASVPGERTVFRVPARRAKSGKRFFLLEQTRLSRPQAGH